MIGLLVSLGAAGLAASQSGTLPWMSNTKKETPAASAGSPSHSPSAAPSASPGSDHATDSDKPKSLFGDVGGPPSSAADRTAARSPPTPGARCADSFGAQAGPSRSMPPGQSCGWPSRRWISRSPMTPNTKSPKPQSMRRSADAANGGDPMPAATAKLLARTKLKKIVDAAEAKNRAYQDALRDVAVAEGRG